MITCENECVGCPEEMGCIGDTCPYMNVKHFYCDWCGDDCASTELRVYNGKHICEDCYIDLAKEKWYNELEMVDECDN